MQLPAFKYTKDYDPETTELVKAFCDHKFEQIWNDSENDLAAEALSPTPNGEAREPGSTVQGEPGSAAATTAAVDSGADSAKLTKKKSLDLWDIPTADLPSHVQLSPDSKVL